MEELLKLQEIGQSAQISKILFELLGVKNATLTEYVIHLAKESADSAEFNEKLHQNDAHLEL